MDQQETFEERIGLELLQKKTDELKSEIGKHLVGKEEVIEFIIISILANGHVLLEGVPGIAKTMIAKLISKMISAEYSRIQFTPDLMPSDVTGTSIFNVGKSEFEFMKGPIFSNMILIDEINRAPAKTQAALFEVMEEFQVTVDGQTMKMSTPFMVMATQNPLEHEGTYRLPEAELDRFLFKIELDYPNLDEEFQILLNFHERKGVIDFQSINPVLSIEEVIQFRNQIQHIQIDENILKYIANIISKTRSHPSLYLGASPRASINTMNAAKACAAINGRDFVIPEDIKHVISPILIHRIYLSPEKELEGISEHQIVEDIINTVEVPR